MCITYETIRSRVGCQSREKDWGILHQYQEAKRYWMISIETDLFIFLTFTFTFESFGELG